MKEVKLNPLHYVSLPGYSFDCWLKSSGVTLDTLQDKQMLDDFVEAKRGGKCGIMGDRYINNRGTRFADGNANPNAKNKYMAKHRRSSFTDDRRSIWYIDANNL